MENDAASVELERFEFGGSTVLVASRGDPVSFYTTVGEGGCRF